ncbi:hypothetical protein ACFU99_06370 [Streptomyces sp. NPDC057654]
MSTYRNPVTGEIAIAYLDEFHRAGGSVKTDPPTDMPAESVSP